MRFTRSAGVCLFSAIAVASCGGGQSGEGPMGPPPAATADISVRVTGPQTAAPGQTITYAITVANAAGGVAAENVVVTDTLPAGVTVTSATEGGTETGGVVEWPSIASVAAGASINRAVSVVVNVEGDLRNVAAATTSTEDSQPSNNNGSGAGTVVIASAAAADLSVTQQGPASALPGDTAIFTVTVSNAGPSRAIGVDVVNVFPAGQTFSTISDGGSEIGGRVTWPTIDTLAAGASVNFTVDLIVPAIGPIKANASGSSTVSDPSGNNNNGFGAGERSLSVTFTPVMSINGESAGDQFGWLMDNLGDVDGDGADDFVVGAPLSNAGGTASGRAYVYSGATGIRLFRFTGAPGETMGFAVDAAGDVNGDGVPDVLVGAPGTGTGRAVAYSGVDGSLIWNRSGENGGDRFGNSVGRLGDVNGDGLADVLVTAPGHDGGGTNTGRVYVLSGADGSTLVTMNSLAPGGQFGSSVGGLGDLTGDGIPDFGVGAPGATGTGRVYVLNGATADTVFFSIAADATGSALGQFWLNSPGDVNGDGVPDIYAADIGNAGGRGRAYVFSGANGSLIHAVSGEAAGDQFGMGRGISDVDGDGVGDLFLAGWRNSEGALNSGKAYIVSGATGQTIRNFVSLRANDNLGFDAVGLGDVTGDGIPDYIISGGISNSTSGRVDIVAGI